MKRLMKMVVVWTMMMCLFVPTIAMANDEYIIVIDSEQDWEEMIEADRVAYQAKVDSVDPNLVRDVENFIMQKNVMTASGTEETIIDVSVSVDEFLAMNPEYSIMDTTELERSVQIASDNAAVTRIRNTFTNAGYELALSLFNHSLLDNPADLYLDLNAANDEFWQYVKRLLNNEGGMVEEVYAYISGVTQGPPHGYEFVSGDLYWGIKKCDLSVVRSSSILGSFTIKDTYDFNILESLATGLAGCSDYYFEISGVILQGAVE